MEKELCELGDVSMTHTELHESDENAVIMRAVKEIKRLDEKNKNLKKEIKLLQKMMEEKTRSNDSSEEKQESLEKRVQTDLSEAVCRPPLVDVESSSDSDGDLLRRGQNTVPATIQQPSDSDNVAVVIVCEIKRTPKDIIVEAVKRKTAKKSFTEKEVILEVVKRRPTEVILEVIKRRAAHKRFSEDIIVIDDTAHHELNTNNLVNKRQKMIASQESSVDVDDDDDTSALDKIVSNSDLEDPSVQNSNVEGPEESSLQPNNGSPIHITSDKIVKDYSKENTLPVRVKRENTHISSSRDLVFTGSTKRHLNETGESVENSGNEVLVSRTDDQASQLKALKSNRDEPCTKIRVSKNLFENSKTILHSTADKGTVPNCEDIHENASKNSKIREKVTKNVCLTELIHDEPPTKVRIMQNKSSSGEEPLSLTQSSRDSSFITTLSLENGNKHVEDLQNNPRKKTVSDFVALTSIPLFSKEYDKDKDENVSFYSESEEEEKEKKKKENDRKEKQQVLFAKCDGQSSAADDDVDDYDDDCEYDADDDYYDDDCEDDIREDDGGGREGSLFISPSTCSNNIANTNETLPRDVLNTVKDPRHCSSHTSVVPSAELSDFSKQNNTSVNSLGSSLKGTIASTSKVGTKSLFSESLSEYMGPLNVGSKSSLTTTNTVSSNTSGKTTESMNLLSNALVLMNALISDSNGGEESLSTSGTISNLLNSLLMRSLNVCSKPSLSTTGTVPPNTSGNATGSKNSLLMSALNTGTKPSLSTTETVPPHTSGNTTGSNNSLDALLMRALNIGTKPSLSTTGSVPPNTSGNATEFNKFMGALNVGTKPLSTTGTVPPNTSGNNTGSKNLMGALNVGTKPSLSTTGTVPPNTSGNATGSNKLMGALNAGTKPSLSTTGSVPPNTSGNTTGSMNSLDALFMRALNIGTKPSVSLLELCLQIVQETSQDL